MPIGRGRDAYRDVYGKREGWGCLHGCLQEGRGMLVGMLIRRWGAYTNVDGDAYRDADRVPIRVSIGRGRGAHKDA